MCGEAGCDLTCQCSPDSQISPNLEGGHYVPFHPQTQRPNLLILAGPVTS